MITLTVEPYYEEVVERSKEVCNLNIYITKVVKMYYEQDLRTLMSRLRTHTCMRKTQCNV